MRHVLNRQCPLGRRPPVEDDGDRVPLPACRTMGYHRLIGQYNLATPQL